jgi:hypothetical protein
MERDMDLVREILLATENKNDFSSWLVPDIEGYTKLEIYYHIKLLIQAGLAEGENLSSHSGDKWVIKTLTSFGHDFLDASRNETVWNKAKASIQSKGLSLTLDLLKMALNDAVMSQFKG